MTGVQTCALPILHDGEVEQGLARFDQAISIGLPSDRVGAFASALVGAGMYVEAAGLRLKY